MRWRGCALGADAMTPAVLLTILLLGINSCDGGRRTSQRRQDKMLYSPAPSVESLQEIAEAMGAAGFEHYTEGKALVKRLIPSGSQQALDVVEYQGMVGRAGVDFPAFPSIPPTGFNCKSVPTGYYADLETDCQVFHICDTSRKISFLCPNGTIFSQLLLICDWWFKVDCASSPALYESSAEYYSNEQKKSQKMTQSLSKNQNLQRIGAETNVRAESRRTPVNVPNTTERIFRSRQRQIEVPKATVKTYQALFADNFNPTQRTAATAALENRRKNLVQLITSNIGIQARSTVPTYTAAPVYKNTPDYNLKEMQVAAESASFANNNNRQYLQDFHTKNYRPYPVYTPNIPKPKSKNNRNLTTLYDIRDKSSEVVETATTIRPSLLPYTKSYTSIIDKQDPYTRPGVSSLKGFLQKTKNQTWTLPLTTEKTVQAIDGVSHFDKLTNVPAEKIEDEFESVTKIPQTTRRDIYYSENSNKYETFSTHRGTPTTETSYQERREKLLKKLNLEPTETTVTTSAAEIKNREYRSGSHAPSYITPKTLHSLAIYYATALDNLSTTPTPEEVENSTPNFSQYEESLPALLSEKTVNKYSSLFNHQKSNAELLEEIREDPNGTYNELSEDLSVMQSQNPLATSPQIRELAQVFTHALSAYLQDPIQFRKVLSDIRPTHPSFGDLLITTEESINTEPTTTVNEEDDEILGFSDDNESDLVSGIRESKAFGKIPHTPMVKSSKYQEEITTTENPAENAPTTYTTTRRNPFICCGKISASYITPSLHPSTTSLPSSTTYKIAVNINTLANNYSEEATTNYSVPKYGGFQNNALTLDDNPYGKDVTNTEGKPINNYIGVTNLPTAWGFEFSGPTTAGKFESKRIKTSTEIPTTTPIYFTETESVELENEEELQRAHSQSFAAPQSNSIRQGKNVHFENSNVRQPAEDLEAPTYPEFDTTTAHTTTQPTTLRYSEHELTTTPPTAPESFYFTSPDNYKTTNLFAWSNNFGNWQSTVIDPITLNDGLSPTAPDEGQELPEQTYIPDITTTPASYSVTEHTAPSTINVEITTHEGKTSERVERLLKEPSSTEAAQDLTTLTDTVVKKAKEMMSGMNATTTEKLMNVMKKTKSKSVKRLILLLIQTCDDDHNTTAEASKKALLDALMAVSQKDMEDITKEDEQVTEAATEYDKTTTIHRRTDRIERQRGDRRGKSLNFESNINALSNLTTENIKSIESETTTAWPTKISVTTRRGIRKFFTRTSPEIKVTNPPLLKAPTAQARVADIEDLKTASDTRALELLRSLYSIAARWG